MEVLWRFCSEEGEECVTNERTTFLLVVLISQLSARARTQSYVSSVSNSTKSVGIGFCDLRSQGGKVMGRENSSDEESAGKPSWERLRGPLT